DLPNAAAPVAPAIYARLRRLYLLPDGDRLTPGFAAFTFFPMAIGATALYKLAHALTFYPAAEEYVCQLTYLADVEVAVAALVVGYVALRFALYGLVRASGSQWKHKAVSG
ncbi:hypothetical protein D8L93_00255, partial [Sodalis-like symbiont of Bactericera trigonica]